MAYSIDKREQSLSFIEKRGQITEIIKFFNVVRALSHLIDYICSRAIPHPNEFAWAHFLYTPQILKNSLWWEVKSLSFGGYARGIVLRRWHWYRGCFRNRCMCDENSWKEASPSWARRLFSPRSTTWIGWQRALWFLMTIRLNAYELHWHRF